MIQVTLRNSLTINGNDKNDTDSFSSIISTSGSNFVSPSVTIPTGSWTTLPSGSNIDFLVGMFTNQDLTSSIYLAVGSTVHTASILTPNSPSCVLSYSGSANVYAQAVGSHSPACLSYKMVSLN